jgi:hypothetical protein
MTEMKTPVAFIGLLAKSGHSGGDEGRYGPTSRSEAAFKLVRNEQRRQALA